MTLIKDQMRGWSIETFVYEYERRLTILDQLVGTLYPAVVNDELRVMEHYSSERWHYHPNWLREKKLLATSWTDPDGVVHDPFVPGCVVNRAQKGSVTMNRKHDVEPKGLTCLWCLGSS